MLFLESLTVLIDHSLLPLARFGGLVNIQYNEIYTSTRSCLVDSVEKWGTPSCLVDIKSSHLVIYVVSSSSSKFLHPSSSARCVLSISFESDFFVHICRASSRLCWMCPLQSIIRDWIGINPTNHLFNWTLDWEGSS